MSEFVSVFKDDLLFAKKYCDYFYFKEDEKVFRVRGRIVKLNGKVVIEKKSDVELVEFVANTSNVKENLRGYVPILHPRKIKVMKERGLSLSDVLKDLRVHKVVK